MVGVFPARKVSGDPVVAPAADRDHLVTAGARSSRTAREALQLISDGVVAKGLGVGLTACGVGVVEPGQGSGRGEDGRVSVRRNPGGAGGGILVDRRRWASGCVAYRLGPAGD